MFVYLIIWHLFKFTQIWSIWSQLPYYQIMAHQLLYYQIVAHQLPYYQIMAHQLPYYQIMANRLFSPLPANSCFGLY